MTDYLGTPAFWGEYQEAQSALYDWLVYTPSSDWASWSRAYRMFARVSTA